MKDERIYIILDPAFGSHLEQLDKGIPVWVVQSEENNRVAAELWKIDGVNLTTFRPQPVSQLLWTIDEHHPGWRKLEFHGFELDEARQAVMGEFGEGRFKPFEAGVIFERGSPSSP